MKKKIIIALALCAALSLTACGGGQAAPIATDESDALANTRSTYEVVKTASDVSAKVGLGLEAPTGAENVCYSIVYGTKEVTENDKTLTVKDETKPEMAQVDFNLNGIPYTYRAKLVSEMEPSDLSGLNMSDFGWNGDAKDVTVANRAAKAYWGKGVGNVYWLDVVPGADYTLTVGVTVVDGEAAEGEITLNDFIAVAESCFVELQGEN